MRTLLVIIITLFFATPLQAGDNTWRTNQKQSYQQQINELQYQQDKINAQLEQQQFDRTVKKLNQQRQKVFDRYKIRTRNSK